MQNNIEDIYPLSPMQEGMLFHTLMAPGKGMYLEQLSCSIEGNFNTAAFRTAWENITARHPVLRSAFVWENLDKPLQVVQRSVEIPFQVMDWRELPENTSREAEFQSYLQKEVKKGFNLSEAPLQRISVIRFTDQLTKFVWSYHHLLVDGWGLQIVLREVFDLYHRIDAGRDPLLPPAMPYREYIAWLQQQDKNHSQDFWKKQLNAFDTPVHLASAMPTSASGKSGEGYGNEKFKIPADLSADLLEFARKYNVTLNSICQGAWAVLLHHYTQQESVLLGITVSGRPPELPGSESIVGLFINTLPLPVTIKSESLLIDWLRELQLKQAEIRKFEYMPLVEIQKLSRFPANVPLFDNILVFENYPVDRSVSGQQGELRITDIQSHERTNYPLTFVVSPGDQLTVEMAYENSDFTRNDVRQIFSHFQNLLRQFCEQPEKPLGHFSLLSESEREQIVDQWNRTSADYPQESIPELFRTAVNINPEAVACRLNDNSLTYRVFNERANQLARFLRRRGVGAEKLVMILFDRSIESVLSIMAVLKAGGAYLPVDPEYPAARLKYILNDSGCGIILTTGRFAEKAKTTGCEVILLDEEWHSIRKEAAGNPEFAIFPDQLAYVIYTSGSTGLPKGTLLSHRGVANFFAQQKQLFGLGPGKKVLQFASLSFDASVWEIFAALLSGSELLLTDRETVSSGPALFSLMRQERITFATLPPTILSYMPDKTLPDLEILITAGEAAPGELVRKWANGRQYYNGYGPTETTVCATLQPWTPDDSHKPPIGRPIINFQLYILNRFLKPLPTGLPGELHISGAGLARGYLGRPELTAEKFVPNPFAADGGSRMYKSGDLVRYLSSGEVDFLGRIDHQVKVRGFRIELGEIEAVLSRFSGIRQNVVVDREDATGVKKLVAYVVAEDNAEPAPQGLREYLASRLPDYMIPSGFVFMESFPLTVSRKIDRKRLPAPEASDFSAGSAAVAPRNHLETLLADIWADVLGLENVGINQNFFELGGHSLLIMQVVSRIRDVFRIELPLNIMFETRNIIELARHIRRAKSVQDGQERATALAPRPRTGKIPLSFSQQRLWFIDQLEPGGNQYNIPAAIRIHGKLDHEVFEKALNSVIQRHESLRTVFRNEKGEPVQVIKEESGLAIPVYDLSHLNADERERQAQSLAEKEVKRPFNLAAGPLLRVVIIKLEAEDQVVVFSLHHIISDGWSVGILIREFADFYKSMEKKESAVLPELPVQYADFAAWQREWLKGTALEEQLRYWKEKLAGAPPLLELPLDFPRPAVQTFNGGRESILLPEDLLKKMKEKSRAQNATLFMMLLALFKILLYRYSGEGDLVVGSPIAGRNHSEIEDLIGFFVNNLVLRTKLSRNETFQEVLEKVRETALEAYLHQDIPFEKLVEELHPVRDLSHSPLFQVMFVMQNLPVPEFKLPGLSVSGFELDGQTSSYDLSLVIQEAPDGLAVEMEYNTDLFRAETIRRMLGHYHRLLTSVSDTDECKIGDIPLLSQNERESITVEWNQTAVNYPENMTAHQIFESVSADFPDSVAVHYSGNISPEDPQKVTYSELNRRANQLAHYLRKMGLRPEGTVAICMERSVEMIMAILAVLKAGGAFLPVDPAHPISRREYMMQDSGTAILLTQEKLLGQSVPDVPQIIAVDRDWDKIRRFGGTNPDSPVTPQNLAYIIYTSGSTGKPKGTLLQHGGLANLATVQKAAFDIQPGKRIMQFSSLSFDASVWEFVMALLNGATLCLTTREVIMSGRNLSGYLRDEKINIITLPPSVLAVLPPADLPELQVLVTAGEAVSTQLVETWCNGRRFFNAYGPTETTVCASMHQCRQGSAANPPIGKPIGNFQLFITEHPLQPVPVGVQAELCVAGAGLARGYMNRPDLTAEKFMPHPFANRAGERLYRTGDLTRYLADGNIEFIGRIDSQVKVRGFRIEPGEIDALLMKHSEIQDSITVVREPVPGDKRLISYIVTSGENEVDVTGIKEYLRGRLPEYMIPSALMPLAKLPLNSSGKVERKALPMPEVTRDTLGTEYVAPRNETEKKLVDITAGLLAAEKVGVNDNFFELGGHSLLATQFMARVLENFGVELPLRILFEKPTVAGIAEEIGKFSNTTEKPAAPAIKKVSRDAHRLKRSEIS